MEVIVVYTIGCPQCDILEKKLQQKQIVYNTINDEKIFDKLNIEEFPMMSVNDGPLMNYKQAITWVNKRGTN